MVRETSTGVQRDLDDVIVFGSATELAELIRRGELSARETVAAHIRRIEATHEQLNAVVIPLFERAMVAAEAADDALAGDGPIGPLHGVPVTIKEQYRVAGTQTTLGATKQVGRIHDEEGPLVTALRRAGAIVMGKTNIIQTLAGWETDNPVYGRTNNPWNLDRSPGGSSGGEGSIVAAGGSALGLAGDFGGSTRIPAHFSGVHGFKPTSGRLSNADFAPGLLGSGQELFVPQPGPIARTVDDVQLAMKVFAATSMSPTIDLAPPVPFDDPTQVDVRGLRVGLYVDNGYFSVSPAIRRAVEQAGAMLEGAGASVVEVEAPDPRQAVRLFLGTVSAGGAREYFELLGDEKPIPHVAGLFRGAKIPGPMRALIAGVMERRKQAFVADQIRSMGPLTAFSYWSLVEERNAYRQTFWESLDGRHLDVILCPPAAVPAVTHGATEHLFPAFIQAFTYNVLGAPAGVVTTTSVRRDEEAGRTEDGDDLAQEAARRVDQGSAGLPVGVQVVGRHWNDHIVLAVMAALERQARETSGYPKPENLAV